MPFKICTVHANRLGIDQNLTHSGQNPQICRCRIFVTCSCHNQGNSHPMFKFCTYGHVHASYSYNRSLGPSGTELLSSIAHLPKASAKGFGTGPVRCLQDRRMEDRAENQILGLGWNQHCRHVTIIILHQKHKKVWSSRGGGGVNSSHVLFVVKSTSLPEFGAGG